MGRRAALLIAASLLPSSSFALQLKLTETLGTVPAASVPPPPVRSKIPYPRASQLVIVALSVNALPKGDRIVRMTDDAQFLTRRQDLDEVAPFLRDAAVYSIDGEDFVALAEIPRVKVAFDERNLALALTLPPEGLPAQHFDLTATPKAADFEARSRSALVNYRLGYAGSDRLSKGTLSLTEETAIAFGDWLLRNQSFHSRSSDDTTNIRLETQLIRDDRTHLRRFVLGDSNTPGLALGSAVPFAGLSLSKAYQLEPYLNRHPGAGYRGIAEFPSQVDFYVGNTLVMRQQVAPGPFDIQNFSYYGGRRDVRVVVRDVFGRQQTIAYPFYFSNQGLAAGLHDYSYQAGWLRGQLGVASHDYGPFVYSAFHQYGFTDAWTLGLRTEGTSSIWNGGPDVFYRNEWLGLFGLHAGVSHDRDSGRNGHAISLSHAFQRGDFSTQIGWQRFSPEYAVVANGIAPRLPKQDFSASIGYATPAFGSLNLAFTRLQLPDEAATRSVSLS
jgi:outer membrane usher protein